MSVDHILLLPEKDYYRWVRAARLYVLTFGVNITPDPVRAGRSQHVTVAMVPGGYPQQGDILAWLKAHFPDQTVDGVAATSADEFEAILNVRVASGERFGKPAAEPEKPPPAPPPPSGSAPFRLYWPTDYHVITQAFGANPEIYSKWGLPGHEGVDIRAPMNTNVYAGADGDVFYVMQEANVHPYGRHIRILHANGYRSVYAHLASVLVKQGDKAKAGQLIGKADSTGNSTGSHLHLTLKKDGATARKETQFSGDVIDPTPYLYWPPDEKQMSAGGAGVKTMVRTYPWTTNALVGANLREDGTMQEIDFEVVKLARLEAVKIQENTSSTVIHRLRQINPEIFIMARIAYDLGQSATTPAEWVAHMRTHVLRLYKEGVQYFEIHQSPNLQSFGWNYSWHSGGGFGRWWLDIVGLLRDLAPQAKFGFPGVSPGGQVEGQRLDAATFLEQADDAIRSAEWVGANCFWSQESEMAALDKGAFWKMVRERYPDKLLFVTEFGNVDQATSAYAKGDQYALFYEQLRNEPGIGAAFAQVLSSSSGYTGMHWRTEQGTITRIPVNVGRRTF